MSMIFSPVGDSCLIELTTAQRPSVLCSVTMVTLHSASTGTCLRSTIRHLPHGAPPWPANSQRSGRPGEPRGTPLGAELHSAGQWVYLALAAQSAWYSMPRLFI